MHVYEVRPRKDHYFEIVDDRAAREYWSLKPLPEGERKIVSMS